MRRPQRRNIHKDAHRLRKWARKDPKRFLVEWNKRLEKWIYEIRFLGGKLRGQREEDEKKKTLNSFDPVFSVLDRAVKTLEYCGEDIQQEVGEKSLGLLSDEAQRQVALAAPDFRYKLCMNLPQQKKAKASPLAK